eukprot:TRINITY_DN5577_c0_g1_i1.p4 TRINITY_DN5577_c0_g1~~TRINITY_DN5577_c0_g1_i1.p4  ORF type:complete len:170 (+),score=13.91 TRINITY_DN5577_c0_g1_i1:819-1328(+)
MYGFGVPLPVGRRARAPRVDGVDGILLFVGRQRRRLFVAPLALPRPPVGADGAPRPAVSRGGRPDAAGVWDSEAAAAEAAEVAAKAAAAADAAKASAARGRRRRRRRRTNGRTDEVADGKVRRPKAGRPDPNGPGRDRTVPGRAGRTGSGPEPVRSVPAGPGPYGSGSF